MLGWEGKSLPGGQVSVKTKGSYCSRKEVENDVRGQISVPAIPFMLLNYILKMVED